MPRERLCKPQSLSVHHSIAGSVGHSRAGGVDQAMVGVCASWLPRVRMPDGAAAVRDGAPSSDSMPGSSRSRECPGGVAGPLDTSSRPPSPLPRRVRGIELGEEESVLVDPVELAKLTGEREKPIAWPAVAVSVDHDH